MATQRKYSMNRRQRLWGLSLRVPLLLAVGCLLAGTLGTPAAAQVPVPEQVTVSRSPAPVPFGPGETFTYKAKWGIFSLGGGTSLSVVGVDDVRGVPSYHLELRMKGGRLGLSVDDNHSSWLGVEDLASRRYIQDIDEVNYERLRKYEIFPEEQRWEQRNFEPEADEATNAVIDAEGETAVNAPLDDISFLYWVRTLPLEVGESYTYTNYFKETGNPVVLNVLRTETIEVPAGTFETIVVQPVIKSKGMFSEDGEAEVYFSNDERRILVRLETKMKVGNLSLHLESVTDGRRLVGAAWPVLNPRAAVPAN